MGFLEIVAMLYCFAHLWQSTYVLLMHLSTILSPIGQSLFITLYNAYVNRHATALLARGTPVSVRVTMKHDGSDPSSVSKIRELS